VYLLGCIGNGYLRVDFGRMGGPTSLGVVMPSAGRYAKRRSGRARGRCAA
jgi:hypothetical protein